MSRHIVSDERLGEPSTNKELFDLLARAGWLLPKLVIQLRNMAAFRNVLVHGYAAADVAIVKDVLANHLDDLLAFGESVRRRLGP